MLVLLLALSAATTGQAADEVGCVTPPQKECLFIVSTGRSGSTALQDGLNQLPGVFIGGENNALLRHVRTLQNLAAALAAKSEGIPQFSAGGDALRHHYDEQVQLWKPDWFTPWPLRAAVCMAQAVIKELYGYGGFGDFMVGFKEVRYHGAFLYSQFPTVWHSSGSYTLPPSAGVERSIDSYEEFASALGWLRTLCGDVRIVLNQRRNATAAAASMEREWAWADAPALLDSWAAWFDRYMEQEDAATPSRVTRVFYEDMAQRPEEVAQHLREFTGRVGPMRFDRIPKS